MLSNKISYSFPYYFGGLKINSLRIGKTFENFDQFKHNYDEYNYTKDPNIFPFLRFKIKINKQFHNILNKKYEIFTEELTTVLNRNYNQSKSKLDTVLDWNFYTKLIYQDPKYFNKIDETCNERVNYKLINNQRGENKFYLDKIFLHKGVDLPQGNDVGEIEKIENIVSKNLVIFNYKGDSKKMVVRLSVWAKISNYFIIEELSEKFQNNSTSNNLKIYDDEWHHILFQFEDDSEKLEYLQIFDKLSFPKAISNLVDRISNSISNKKINNQLIPENKIKIVDFDFSMSGSPLSDNISPKNEFYYLTNNY